MPSPVIGRGGGGGGCGCPPYYWGHEYCGYNYHDYHGGYERPYYSYDDAYEEEEGEGKVLHNHRQEIELDIHKGGTFGATKKL